MDIHEDALEGQDEARRKKREREEAEQARLEVFKQQASSYITRCPRDFQRLSA